MLLVFILKSRLLQTTAQTPTWACLWYNPAQGVCCLCECEVQRWPHCLCFAKHGCSAQCTDSPASFLRAAENLRLLLIHSHVNRASPVSSSRYVCSGVFQQKMAYAVVFPTSIFVHGFCDITILLIASTAKSEV